MVTGLVAAIGFVAAVASGCTGSADIERQAYADYAQGAFRASAEAYRAALAGAVEPISRQAALRYNLGAAEYRLKQHDTCVAELTQAAALASRNRAKRASAIEFRALYNLGNAHFRRGDFEQAVTGYRRALVLSPDHESSKHNLELALQELRRRPEAGGPRDTENRQRTPEPGDGLPTPVPDTPVGLSAEEAQRLLDMLGEDDLGAQRRRLQQMVPPTADPDRDW